MSSLHWLLSGVVFILAVPLTADAGYLATLMGTSITDDFNQGTAATNTSSSNTYFGGLLMASLDSKETIYFGMSYNSISRSSTANSIATSFSTVDMGPAFIMWFGKGKEINISGSYLITSEASLSVTSQTPKSWHGTGYWFGAGFETQFSKYFSLGARIVYYKDSYTDQKAGTTASTVSVDRTWLLPMLTLSIHN